MGLRHKKDSLKKYHESKLENERLKNKVAELEERDSEKDIAITELELNDIEKDLAITDLELAVLSLQEARELEQIQQEKSQADAEREGE